MSINDQASYIIVIGFWSFVASQFLRVLVDLWEWVDEVRRKRDRRRQHARFVAARVAAREATEARLRAEGRWDNFEIQDAMDRAGREAAPGYRP